MNVKNGSFSIAKSLIEKGADLSLRDEDGNTPFDVAVEVSFSITLFVLI